MDPESAPVLDRTDQRLLRLLVHLVAALTVLAYAVAPLLAWLTDSSLSRVIDLRAAAVPDALRPGARIGGTQGEVELVRPSAVVRLVDLLPGVLIVVGMLLAAWAVLRVLRCFARGRIFSDAVVSGLRLLGLLLVFLPIGVGLANGVADAVFADAALRPQDGAEFSLTFDLGLLPITFVSGLFVIALAQGFGRGRRMARELEGLV